MSRSLSLGLTTAATACLLAWGIAYASIDLWWDEIISLKEYALVGLSTTVTNYPDPNNHILFNLLNNVFTGIEGERDLYTLANEAAALRWLQWVLGLGTGLYVLLTGKRFTPVAGALSFVLLVTCLPYLNFTMQLRGYNMSMFFAAGLVHHVWSSEEKFSRLHLAAVAVMTFGMIYTVPSSAYFVLAVALFVVHRTIRPPSSSEGTFVLRRAGVTLALALGAAAALLAYVPVLDTLLDNRFVNASPADRMFILSRRLPEVMVHLLSFRYLLIPVVLAGFVFALKKGSTLPGRDRAVPLLGLLLLPFLFSFLRNDVAFQRTFIMLAPVFALILGVGSTWFLDAVGGRLRRKGWLVAVVAVYAFATLVFADSNVQRGLRRKLETGIRAQNIMSNYYQLRDYSPSRVAAELADAHGRRPGPILLVDELDRLSLSLYLEDHDLVCTSLVKLTPAGGQGNSTHTGMFQRSRGRGEDLGFFQSELRLPATRDDDSLTPLLVVARTYEPSQRYYVITAFGEKNRKILEVHHPELGVEIISGDGAPHGFETMLLTER